MSGLLAIVLFILYVAGALFLALEALYVWARYGRALTFRPDIVMILIWPWVPVVILCAHWGWRAPRRLLLKLTGLKDRWAALGARSE